MFSQDRQCKSSPNTPSPSNANKSFLTPCRRMGLKRKSPASSNQNLNKKPLVAINEKEISETDYSCDLSSTLSDSKSETPKRKNIFNPPISRNNSSQPGEVHSFISSSETNSSNGSSQCQSNEINSSCDNTDSLQKRIAEKEKQLHCLKQAVIYRKKHDIEKLAEMVLIWKTGCQDALRELLIETKGRGNELNMAQLLNQLRIPHELVGYSKNIDEFE